jgi:hypothetical protein
MRRTAQLVRLMSVEYCKRLTLKVVVAVSMVFVLQGGGMVVSKGGWVVDGVFAKRPAFALLDATSVFFKLAVLFAGRWWWRC